MDLPEGIFVFVLPHILNVQVLSDGTLLMKEVRENIEELTCQVKMWPLDMENHSIGAKVFGPS